ncbi:unnamed protein product [Rangifer tarandus platyrhynchus]|uniref:Uncharacterized protein n=1 Tax=Rangifer tarandus platyrhynchus TaxID=3082113 RepID=A0AC59YW95_RANTA
MRNLRPGSSRELAHLRRLIPSPLWGQERRRPPEGNVRPRNPRRRASSHRGNAAGCRTRCARVLRFLFRC